MFFVYGYVNINDTIFVFLVKKEIMLKRSRRHKNRNNTRK